MAYQVGTYLKELEAEHRAGEHVREGKYLDPMCPQCIRLGNELDEEHYKGRHTAFREHCLSCRMESREEEEA